MKQTTKNNLVSGKQIVAGLIAASQCAAQAQEAKEQLESLDPTTVIATKFESKLSDVSATVSVLDLEQLEREGVHSLKEAIGYRTPGVIATSTAGQGGQPGSLLIRGTTSKYSQMRLDGVRVTGSNSGGILNFLGASNLNGVGSIEVLKGAGSSLYGNGAIGGVVSVNTERGAGKPEHKAHAEYGSYNSAIGHLSSKGRDGALSYNIGFSVDVSDNDTDSQVDKSASNQKSLYSRFDYDLGSDASVGMTLRVGNSSYETPQYGDVATKSPQSNNYAYVFGSLFYQNQISDFWQTRVTLGMSDENYDDGYNYVYSSESDTFTDRYSAYWDNELHWHENHNSVVSVYFEHGDYVDYNADSFNRDTYGLSLNHRWQIVDAFSLSGRAGLEDHSNFGIEPTWGAGALYLVSKTTRIKANAGTAFLAPSFAQTAENSSLNGERSFNWDIGVEQSLFGVDFEATWFENDLKDKVTGYGAKWGDPFKNGGDQKASGLEFAVNAPMDSIQSNAFASYTYNQRALHTAIPQQYAAAGIDSTITDKLNAGLVGTWVDKRQSESADSNSVLDSYLLLNLYANYIVTENVKVHARIDNLLNSAYRLSDFRYHGELDSVKGRGRGLYAGVTATF